jgi:hypothetical protein
MDDIKGAVSKNETHTRRLKHIQHYAQKILAYIRRFFT